MTDIQHSITRLRAADEQCPDFWNTLTDRDADPQVLRDVVAVARSYVRNETVVHRALEIAMAHIANKAAEGLGE